ncbi:hypothetical protein M5689_018539 [Euphorbia peplus]|nr:hypothetical protein M5689_018539 [Euphorbia peplus]
MNDAKSPPPSLPRPIPFSSSGETGFDSSYSGFPGALALESSLSETEKGLAPPQLPPRPEEMLKGEDEIGLGIHLPIMFRLNKQKVEKKIGARKWKFQF